MPPPHLWDDVVGELSTWMEETPDAIASSIIGESRPYQPQISHEDQMQFHLEHLYPPQLGGQMDPQYIQHLLTVGTADEVKSLRQALNRYVTNKATQPSPTASGPASAGVTGGADTAGAPYPHLRQPQALPAPPQQYAQPGY